MGNQVAGKKYVRLSYDLAEDAPHPSDLQPVRIEHTHDMNRGKISNVYTIAVCNHVGSHVDGPNHFGRYRKPLNQFDINDFVYGRPVVLDIPKGDGELVVVEDLMRYDDEIAQCDLLLIRTGHSLYRSQDSDRYTKWSPGLAGSASEYIANHFSNVRALGMDTLSIGSPQHPEEGIRAHQVFADQCEHDIFLLEDINLAYDLSRIQEVIVAPLFCEQIDSAPCTVLARIG